MFFSTTTKLNFKKSLKRTAQRNIRDRFLMFSDFQPGFTVEKIKLYTERKT